MAAHIEVKSQLSHLEAIHGSELILPNGFGRRSNLPSPTVPVGQRDNHHRALARRDGA
jgi:hypothetical protein